MPASKQTSDLEKRSFWWCGGKDGCGHVVGEIGYKDLQQGGRVRALLVYETSVDTPPAEVPPIRAKVVTGYDMQCTVDHAEFDWYPSKESLQRLLAHYQPKDR